MSYAIENSTAQTVQVNLCLQCSCITFAQFPVLSEACLLLWQCNLLQCWLHLSALTLCVQMLLELGSSRCRSLHAIHPTLVLCAILFALLLAPPVLAAVSSDPDSGESVQDFCVRWDSGDSATSKYYCDVNKDIGVACDPAIRYDLVQRVNCAAGEVKLRYSSEFTNPMELRCYEQCFPAAAGEAPAPGTDHANAPTNGEFHSCREKQLSSLCALSASLLLLLLAGVHI
jgi:hypothetical protein